MKLYENINSDSTLRNEFKKYIGDQEIYKFINDIIENSQNILIIIDGEKSEIAEISEVYTDTWGKMVKHIVLKKYSDGKESIYHLEPDLEILEIVGDEKIPEGKTSYDEAHHTDGINDSIVSIYQELKDRVLLIDPNLIFNPTKYYISIKGRKNFAFIKIRKKRITLIPLVPEDEIRKRVTKYQVKSLPQSVKDFWNGECAHILVEDANGMDELLDVLSLAVEEDE